MSVVDTTDATDTAGNPEPAGNQDPAGNPEPAGNQEPNRRPEPARHVKPARDSAPSQNQEPGTQRALSFGTQAAAYAEHRPDYAQSAVKWALDPVLTRESVHVLDLGAGTGKLTGVITTLAATRPPGQLTVVAAEPDPAMLAEFRTHMPGIQVMTGRAEDIPLPGNSVDAVLCGQAAHWFDLDKALPEIARVLTGGGVFAGLWNMDDDRVPWVAGLLREYNPTMAASEWRQREHNWLNGHRGSEHFRQAEKAVFEHGQERTADSLVALLATHSRQILMDPATRAENLGRIRDYLASRPETAHGVFRYPMLTGVLRTVKL